MCWNPWLVGIVCGIAGGTIGIVVCALIVMGAGAGRSPLAKPTNGRIA